MLQLAAQRITKMVAITCQNRGATTANEVELPERRNLSMHFVYILRCADGTLYTGYARDPAQRAKAHNAGKGAKYTCGRRPVVLIYSESFPTLGDALKREHQLKHWTRKKKEALIAGKYTRSRRLV